MESRRNAPWTVADLRPGDLMRVSSSRAVWCSDLVRMAGEVLIDVIVLVLTGVRPPEQGEGLVRRALVITPSGCTGNIMVTHRDERVARTTRRTER
jgi:hypothetical protein